MERSGTTETTLQVFEELAAVLQSIRLEGDFAKLSPQSSVGQAIISQCIQGLCFEEALFLLCSNPHANFRTLLFGSSRLSYERETQVLEASDGERRLIVKFNASKDSIEALSRDHGAIIVSTDFESFGFYRTDKTGQLLKPFVILNAREMSEEISFAGSIWDSIYPTHYAIISRTLSCTFPRTIKGGSFFKTLGAANTLEEEQSARKELDCFQGPLYELLSLDSLRHRMQSCSKPPQLLSECREGDYTVRRYNPQRSSIFDFGTPAEQFSRDDFVITYHAGNIEFHREFFVSPQIWNEEDEELRIASFDLLHMLAIRRAKLFRSGFARRVYNILLPPACLKDEVTNRNSYVLFPCLNVYRTARHGFRRTVSLTFLVSPVETVAVSGKPAAIVSRPAPLEELYRLKSNLLSHIGEVATSPSIHPFVVSGPGKSYFGLFEQSTLPDLLRDVTKSALRRVLAPGYTDDSENDLLVASSVFTSSQESRLVTMSLQVDWTPPEGFAEPWERWLATGNDVVFCNSLFRTLFYLDYLDPSSAEASRTAVRFEELNIGNTMGADMGGMTLYNPQESLKVVLYPKAREKYPNYSMVRWMTWQVYIDSALASLHALIYRFHPMAEERGSLRSLIHTLDEMIEEFVDFYDLDIRDYFYRMEYQKLRKLMQLDIDYAHLQSKIASSKEDESLREQRLINKLIVSLTIATVTITIVSTIAQVGKLGILDYVIISLAASTVLVWLGYNLFDPLRLGYRWVHNAISRFWR